MPLMNFKLLDLNFTVDTQNDHYGLDFWNGFANLQYEPDTVILLYSLSGPGVHFMDLGAANGAMSLIAMLRGSQVTSYEPNPEMFEVLKTNMSRNPGIAYQKKLCSI